MSYSKEDIKKLIGRAKSLVSDGALDPGRFLELANDYLSEFERWQEQIEIAKKSGANVPDADKEQLKALIEELKQVHVRVIEAANSRKEDVADQMGEVHRRAHGLKRYVDRFPSRITIAGRRRG